MITMNIENTYDDNPLVARFLENELHARCEITRVDLDENGSVSRLDMVAKEIYICPRVIMEE